MIPMAAAMLEAIVGLSMLNAYLAGRRVTTLITASGQVGPGEEAEIQALLTQWSAVRLKDPNSAGRIYDQLLALVEPPVLQAVVQDQGGQVAASARLMGLHRTTLRKKLDQYGFDKP
jgi:DNA-binding protein Fis